MADSLAQFREWGHKRVALKRKGEAGKVRGTTLGLGLGRGFRGMSLA